MDHNKITGDRFPQMGIPDHAGLQELDFPVEAFSRLLDESKIAVRHGRGRGGFELREEIDIAVFTLLSPRGGSEHGKTTDTEKPSQRLSFTPECPVNHRFPS